MNRLRRRWLELAMYRSREELAADREADALRSAIEETPALGEALARQELWDRWIAGRLEEVALPEGLAGRLVARVRQAEQESAGGAEKGRAPRWQRRLVRVAALCAAVAVLAAGAWYGIFRETGSPWTDREWQAAIARVEGAWDRWPVLPPGGESRTALPLDPVVLAVPREARRFVLAGHRAVEYRGRTPGGVEWRLAVVRSPKAAPLAPLPPKRPTALRSGWWGAVWRNGDCVYILRFRGGPSAYHRILQVRPRLADGGVLAPVA